MVAARVLQSIVVTTLAITIDCWTVPLTKQATHNVKRRFHSLFSVPIILSSSTVLSEEILDTYGVSSWLVCGDGDLSYSAAIAPHLSQSNTSLTATVLEDQSTHHSVYSNSKVHTETIISSSSQQQQQHNHHDDDDGNSATVCFGIDATRLEHHFPGQKFDRIQFNFPHWRGKSNNRRNRELLTAFFASAVQVLSSAPQQQQQQQHNNNGDDDDDGGEIQIALCQNQGGFQSRTMQEWKGSWMAAMYAAEHGMLLKSVDAYQPIHDLSSHRGVDRPFSIGREQPQMYRFGFPNNKAATPVDRDLQLCCRHELHIVLPDSSPSPEMTLEDIVEGNAIQQFSQNNVVSEGIKVDVPLREIRTTAEGETMVIFLMVYRGESLPLTRASVDSYRAKLETELGKILHLPENRVGRLVSKPFPYTALDAVIEEHKNVQR